VPSDATPPKRPQPVPVRGHTDLGGVPGPKNLPPGIGGPSHPTLGEAGRHQQGSVARTMTPASHMSDGDYLITTP